MNQRTPNADHAKQDYTPDHDGKTHFFIRMPMTPLAYSDAYVISNEELRWTTGITARTARRVLTVAGSGDHAIFYHLNGAKHIDTFDISYCARAIMDTKTAAIQALPYGQYCELLSRAYKNPHIAKIDLMQPVLSKMPTETANFIQQMDGYQIFANGMEPEYYPQNMPSESEYQKLKQTLQQPFNFIWSDLYNLHTHLSGEYDVINLSNIFEWVPKTTIPTLESLRPHIRLGGHIIAHTSCFINQENTNQYMQAQKKFDWAKIGLYQDPKTREYAVILQRTR